MISFRKGYSALTLAAVVALGACSNSDNAAAPLVAAKLIRLSVATVTVGANLPTSDPLKVRLYTANDRPVPSRVVHFSVSGSGASVSADSVFTDENGDASVFVIAGAAGTYTVTASSPGATPVTFTVNATAPQPNLVAVFAGDNQAGLAGEPLVPFDAIILKQDGTPVGAGIPITFAVTGGGGSLSTTSTTTNASGHATTILTLGLTGAQTVSVNSPGLQGTTFNATVADPCSAARQATTPGTFTRSLDATDCHNPQNRYVEYFNTTVTSTPLRFTESSTAFVPSFSIRTVGGADTIAFHTPGSGDATFKAFLAPGSYWLAPSSSAANATGAYTVTSVAIAGTDITACERTYITRGATSGSQTLAATDCPLTFDDQGGNGAMLHYADQYRLFLKAGDKITVTMTGTFDLLIRMTDLGTGVVNTRDNGGPGGTEVLSYTAQTTGQYRIDASSYNGAPGGTPPDSGPYTITVAAAP